MTTMSKSDAWLAHENGTATLAQYAFTQEDKIEGEREWLLAQLPALVAREQADGAITPASAPAYPPGATLPEVVAEALSECFWPATSPRTGPDESLARRHPTPYHRARNAVTALALGHPLAMPYA